MRRVPHVLALLLLTAGPVLVRGEKPREPPLPVLPVPPAQSRPWAPPDTELPANLLEAARLIFEVGAGDPRGLPYRKLTVTACRLDTGGEAVEATGWVLPAKEGEEQRFAVLWNGVVSPCLTVGEESDPEADVRALLATSKAIRGGTRPDPFEDLRYKTSMARWSACEEETLGATLLWPIHVCMLLRLGKGVLAEESWRAFAGHGDREEAELIATHPFVPLARDFLGLLWERTLCAHMRSDDEAALTTVRFLDTCWTRTRVIAERDPARLETFDDQTERPGQLDALVRDQERRRRRQGPGPADLRTIRKITDPAERTAALIEALEDVTRHASHNTYSFWIRDPVYTALIEEGEAAVDLLLDCLEKDDRLSRWIHVDKGRGCTVIPAWSFAENLLTSTFGSAWSRDLHWETGREMRAAAAAAARKLWRRWRGLSVPERWFDLLADDEAGADTWLEAARAVVRRNEYWDRPPGPMLGEPLRGRVEPSLADLLARRIREVYERERLPRDRDGLGASGDIAELGSCLARWDAADRETLLLAVVEHCTKLFRDYRTMGTGKRWLMHGVAVRIVTILESLALAGNSDAWERYAAWVRETPTEAILAEPDQILRPLWIHGEDPALRKLLGWILAGEDSPWPAEFREQKSLRTLLLLTGLLEIPRFREHLATLLEDRTVVGTASARDGERRIDPLAPAEGVEVPVRLCDLIAEEISRLPGSPKFQRYWPEKRRDLGVAATARFLRRFGGRLRLDPLRSQWLALPGWGRVDLFFPVRDRAATPEEAAQGDAIFSLGEGEVRVVTLPETPMTAQWTALEDNPLYSWAEDEEVRYERHVLVWQAEERKEGDRWRRFFGVVHQYGVAQVPAEEIDFVASYESPGRLTGPVHAWIEPGDRWPQPEFDPNGITLHLMNRTGFDIRIPETLARPGASLLHESLALECERTDQLPAGAELEYSGVDLSKPRKWSPVAARPVSPCREPGPGRTLGPGEETEPLRIDPHDWFVIDSPGLYRIRVRFDGAPFGTGVTGYAYLLLEE